MTTERPTALVVLGMHRSGTSAVAGALVARGANAGGALLPSTSDNANGYFEDARLVAASDALLAAAGLGWDVPGPVARPLVAPAAMTAMTAVFAALRDTSAIAVVKDPRACRLVPEWSQAMADAGLRPAYLIVVRDPREVTGSLQARDGMSAFRAQQLWLEHLLEAEFATRGAPRAFLDFDALLREPDATLDAVLATLQMGDALRSEAAQGSGVEARLRRQRADGQGGAGFADAVYALAKRLAGTAGRDASTEAAFDGFRARWRSDAEVAHAALADAQARGRQDRDEEIRMLREVRRGLALSDAWAKPLQSAPRPRVYWRAADVDHSEDRSCAALGGARGGFTARVEGEGIARLRIDPDHHAGVFEIADVVVGDSSVTDLASAVLASNGVIRATAQGVMLVAVDDDPWVEIGLPAGVEVQGALPVRFTVRGRGLPELLWGLVEQEAFGAARLRQLEARVEALAEAQAALVAPGGALSRLLQQSAEILGWTRRRTFRYWWRRWRGEVETPEGTS